MILESILAYLHIAAILAMVVFISSEAALCRPEWMNAAIVQRLGRVNAIYGFAAAAVVVTGLARVFLGVKGVGWYGTNWLLHLKIASVIVVAAMSVPPTRAFSLWRSRLAAGGPLPAEAEIRAARKWVMRQAHLIPLIPIAAVFLARGFGK